MKLACYVCDCGCMFAIDWLSIPEDPTCPACGDDVDATGECIKDPNIVFDRDAE